ncbi:TIGR02300 family protein [Azospirillum argentinense]|uniref:TIGR02300 family protein n=1 Tax=Azospirillum argentinense TaxID=2970906 RepID=A0A4D8P8Q4_9PROT|nr:TIGR02300 family protein [Azospirillum argentinense]QCN95203.1 TIGR02300 family protein [Azospirillum argentinense]
MAKPEWGVKRICPSCGARYYDLRKDPPVCPNCGSQFDPEALLKSRKARPAPVDDVKKAPVVSSDEDAETETEDEESTELDEVEDDVTVDDIEETDETPEDEDDVLIEDTSELGEDDMDEVVDVEGEDEEER